MSACGHLPPGDGHSEIPPAGIRRAKGVGEQVQFAHGGSPFTIVGVVRDVHIESLHEPLQPILYRYVREAHMARFVSVRLRKDRIDQALALLESSWQFQDQPFEYWFVEDSYRDSYRDEDRLTRLIGSFGLFAILLSSFGLFGLAAVSTRQRTREIGVRKCIGATARDIVMMLSREFAALAALGTVLALPVAIFACARWLETYPYRVPLSPQPFITGALVTVVVVLATVSLHAVRAAQANPVDALRSE